MEAAGQWPQTREDELLQLSKDGQRAITERKARPSKDQALNCPRCNSTNTKFCYYNNYSLSQPRYFCKTCRRYWTEGGTLRNVPVGGGSRKNKRSSSSAQAANASSSKKLHYLTYAPPAIFPLSHAAQNPSTHECQDLNLLYHNPSETGNAFSLSTIELLKTGILPRDLTPFMSMSGPNMNSLGPSDLPSLSEFKQSLNFSFEGYGHEYGNESGPIAHQSGAVAGDGGACHRSRDEHPGFWNGMLGGGSW